MIREHDRVMPTAGSPAHSLRAGDVATGGHLYADDYACALTFCTLDGRLDVRPIEAANALQARLGS